MELPVRRIAVIGPESSGKSTLCEQLAARYHTAWIPEYARTYLPLLNRPYTSEDVEKIYRTQWEQEAAALPQANRFLFTDTECIIAQVWLEHAFGISSVWFHRTILQHPYDLYLVTAPDLPWTPDPLRENPGKGAFFFNWYQQLLQHYRLPFGIVSGSGTERFEEAVRLLETNR